MVVEGLDWQPTGWKSPHCSLVLSAMDLATFCGICSTEWPYMTPFGMNLFSASLYPTTSWLPTAPIEALVVLAMPEIELSKMAG